MNSPIAPRPRFPRILLVPAFITSSPNRQPTEPIPKKKTHHPQLVSLVETALPQMKFLPARYAAVIPYSVPFKLLLLLLLCPSNDALLPLVRSRALLVRRGRGRKSRAVRVVGGVVGGICMTLGSLREHLLRRGDGGNGECGEMRGVDGGGMGWEGMRWDGMDGW